MICGNIKAVIIMTKKMFDKNLPKKCEYCLNAEPIGNDGEMVCKKRGIVESNDYCRSYKYDPLKRTPQRPIESDQYSPEDFKL